MTDATATQTLAPGQPRVFVVLPCFNEQENLPALLEGLQRTLVAMRCDYRIILVDDGSKDDSLKIARSYARLMPLQVVCHEVNQGLGVTLRDGLRAALEQAHPDDAVITLDADNSHPPGLMPRMLQMLQEGRDLVIASRYQPLSVIRGVPWHRRQLSNVAGWVMRLSYPMSGVRDYTCGYRAYRVSLLQTAAMRYGDKLVESRGFQCMAELLFKLRTLRPVCGEAPLVLRYDLKGGVSKMRVLRTITNTLKLMLRQKLAR